MLLLPFLVALPSWCATRMELKQRIRTAGSRCCPVNLSLRRPSSDNRFENAPDDAIIQMPVAVPRSPASANKLRMRDNVEDISVPRLIPQYSRRDLYRIDDACVGRTTPKFPANRPPGWFYAKFHTKLIPPPVSTGPFMINFTQNRLPPRFRLSICTKNHTKSISIPLSRHPCVLNFIQTSLRSDFRSNDPGPDDSQSGRFAVQIFHIRIFPHSATEVFETDKFYNVKKGYPVHASCRHEQNNLLLGGEY